MKKSTGNGDIAVFEIVFRVVFWVWTSICMWDEKHYLDNSSRFCIKKMIRRKYMYIKLYTLNDTYSRQKEI